MRKSSCLGVLAALTLAACAADPGWSDETDLSSTSDPAPPASATEHVATAAQALVPGTDSRWGLLANPDFSSQPVKGTYFFAGSEKDGSNAYADEQNIYNGSNLSAYSVYPADSRDLLWSKQPANQDFALKEMTDANVNTIVMSSWGVRFNGDWAAWAPMQTSRWAHDELFDAAVRSTQAGHPVAIMPAIESTPLFSVANDLTTFTDDSWMNAPSPLPPGPQNTDNSLRAQIDDLVTSYVCLSAACRPLPGNVTRESRFVKIFDQTGTPRFAIHLLSMCLNGKVNDPTGALAATALDNLAAAVKKDTGVLVGFTVDPVDMVNGPCGTAGGAVPPSKGPGLAKAKSLLAIQPYRSEMLSSGDKHSDHDRIVRKRDFINRWVSTGIPVFLDATPGYDGDRVFGKDADPSYGNNDNWRNYEGQLIGGGIRGITMNAWNGYTEGWAAMPYRNAAWDPRSSSGAVNYAQWSWTHANFGLDPRLCNTWQLYLGQPQFQTFGAICEKWRAMGGTIDGNPLGNLAGPERDGGPSQGGLPSRVSDFANGRIYFWNGVARAVHGDIFRYYRDVMHSEFSGLGLPTSPDEIQTVHGRMSVFEGGEIMWGAGTHAVYGFIGQTYRQMGWDSSYLQLPLSDEGPYYGCSAGRAGRVSQFQGGYIYWCAGDGAATAVYAPVGGPPIFHF